MKVLYREKSTIVIDKVSLKLFIYSTYLEKNDKFLLHFLNTVFFGGIGGIAFTWECSKEVKLLRIFQRVQFLHIGQFLVLLSHSSMHKTWNSWPQSNTRLGSELTSSKQMAQISTSTSVGSLFTSLGLRRLKSRRLLDALDPKIARISKNDKFLNFPHFFQKTEKCKQKYFSTYVDEVWTALIPSLLKYQFEPD